MRRTLKQAIKCKVGFSESYHGFRSFGQMLEEAQARKWLTLQHARSKLGGYPTTTSCCGGLSRFIRRHRPTIRWDSSDEKGSVTNDNHEQLSPTHSTHPIQRGSRCADRHPAWRLFLELVLVTSLPITQLILLRDREQLRDQDQLQK